MLDPFTALSLAGNILQFIQAGHTALCNCLEIYRSGAVGGNRQLEIVTRDLTSLSRHIEKATPQGTTSSGSSPTEDHALQDLARQTTAISQELLDVLSRLQVTKESSRHGLESLRRALRSVVSEDKIHELEQRLVTLRSELTLRVLVSLSNSSAAQAIKNDSRFETLGAELQITIRDILDGDIALLSVQIDQSTATLARQQQNQHKEILELLSDISCSSGTLPRREQAVQSLRLTDEKAKQTEDFILQQLTFREISDRADSIDRAHENTFKWIFDEDFRPDEKWSNFAEWLRGNDSIYWVCGKAGSGKSTLMKYLAASEKTATILRKWAGDSTLHIASFYFWNLGTALQRSQAGLLRALLLSLLAKNRHLLQTSMSGYYTDVSKTLGSDMRALGLKPLSDVEVRAAFIKTVKELPSNTHVCIFIDGLDEYEGNVPEILDILLPVTSDRFRLVISSRPIPSCLSAFEYYPQLRLEDLTRPDILSYAKQRLESHPNARRLKQHYQDGMDALIEEVVRKSSGVFLWVALVVKVLLHRLDAGDKMEELTQQLDALPTELGPFYKHMMDRMETSYRKQASWYLQMVLRSVEVQVEHPLDLMQCSLAEFYGETSAFPESDRDLMDPDSSFWRERCLLMERRLISRCCGLVEAPNQRTVAFIHKSVADFLRQPDIWKYIVDLTKDEENDISFVLGRSRALYMKILWPRPLYETPLSSGLFRNTRYCLKYIREGEASAHRTSLQTLRDLSSHISLWARSSNQYLHFGPVPGEIGDCGGEICYLPPMALDKISHMQADMYIAACAGLPLHLKQICSDQTIGWLGGGRATSKEDDWLLSILVCPKRLTVAIQEGFLSKNVEIVQYLLEIGSDPNRKAETKPSSWEQLLINLLLPFTRGRVQQEDHLLDRDQSQQGFNKHIISASLHLLPAFLRSGAQSEATKLTNILGPTTARAKKLALACIEKLANLTSPEDGQLYLEVIEARKTLLEMSENLNIKTARPKNSSFSKLFSRVLRKSDNQQALTPVNTARSTVAR